MRIKHLAHLHALLRVRVIGFGEVQLASHLAQAFALDHVKLAEIHQAVNQVRGVAGVLDHAGIGNAKLLIEFALELAALFLRPDGGEHRQPRPDRFARHNLPGFHCDGGGHNHGIGDDHRIGDDLERR